MATEDKDVAAAFKLVGDVLEALTIEQRMRVLHAMYIVTLETEVDAEIAFIGFAESSFRRMVHEQRVRAMAWAQSYVRSHAPQDAPHPEALRWPRSRRPRGTPRRERRCSRCGVGGHDVRRCPKKKPKEEWPANIEVDHVD